MQETSSFHSETNRQTKTKKADKNLQSLPPSVHCIKMRLKKTQKKISSAKTETKLQKNFQGEGKTYQKFVASRIHCNAESGEAVREW
jgi:hypothetical protein